MKFIIKNIEMSVSDMVRTIGYHVTYFQEGKEISVVRTLTGNSYPRFHLYIRPENSSYVFNLHLDQKKPSYGKWTAHSGEYHGKLVHDEAKRIQDLLSSRISRK